jgi:hypothetical protein
MMRRSLFWALLGTLAASALTLWVGRQAPVLVAAVERAGARAELPAPQARAAATTALPARLERLGLEPSRRDPFVAVVPPQPKPALAPAPPPMQMAGPPPPPPLPSAPAVRARFLGRMVTPAGDKLVFLSAGDKTVLAQAGDVLDDGYVVDSVTDQAVVLRYPALDVKVTLPLPPLPAS